MIIIHISITLAIGPCYITIYLILASLVCVNVLEMKCLRSLVGVSRMDKLGMKRCVGELE